MNCPTCGGARVHEHVASRQSGQVVAHCRGCGYSFIANPPPPTHVNAQYDVDRDDFAAFVDGKRHTMLEGVYTKTLDTIRTLLRSSGSELFDVGAGGGEFLAAARNHGFVPHGNDLAQGAVDIARETHGIELERGELSDVAGENRFDAMTMWCVLAHVPDPDELLQQTHRLLKPGGVLYMQTPRWSVMDSTALAMSSVTGGRFARVLDRRIHTAHLRLHSAESMAAQIVRHGFEVVTVKPRARYTLQTRHYLESLGMSERVSTRLAKVIDEAVDRDLVPRNILDVFARKPLASS